VYGGGGIMPDYFVPFDTSFYSTYYRDLIGKGILNQYILNYGDKNRTELSNKFKKFNEFKNNFVISDDIINGLIEYAQNEGVEYKHADFKKSEPMIRILCKAYLARDLWEISEFYQIFNETDPIYKRAIEVLSESSLYDKKLEAYTGE